MIRTGKPGCSEQNLSQCLFFHHKLHTDWPGIESGPPLCSWRRGTWHDPNTPAATPHVFHTKISVRSLLFDLYKVSIITSDWRHSLKHGFPNCVPRSSGGCATWVAFPCAFTNNLMIFGSVNSKIKFARLQYPKQ